MIFYTSKVLSKSPEWETAETVLSESFLRLQDRDPFNVSSQLDTFSFFFYILKTV